MLDGARNALLGFLYQLLGTASLRVREVPEGDDAWASLIARVGDGVLRCEEFGQDATIRPSWMPDQGVVAIQFKHSATVGNVIERGELIDIIFALDRSRREAAADDVTIDRYFLITNRGLHANTQQLLEEGRTSPQPPAALRVSPATRSGEPITANIKRLEPYGDDPDVAAGALHTVLRAFSVPPKATFEEDLNRLRKVCGHYGVLNSEWDSRVNTLIGAFVRETAGGQAIAVTREWLKRHLVGDPNAAYLHFGLSHEPHISTACRGRIDERIQRQHRIPAQCYWPRDIQQRIRDELEGNSIVFVHGDGGCGKSLAVARFLRSVWAQELVWSEPARTGTESGIVEAINRVRLPGCQGGWADRTLADIRARLVVANSPGCPVMTIDLDGIDEAPDCRSALFNLINHCWAEGNRDRSPARLVVTSRSPETGSRVREELISKWLDTPEADLVSGVGFVTVGEFLRQDLVEAARLLGGRPEERIITDLDPDMASSWTRRFPASEAINADILASLCHPVVWGSYASLSENDRDGVLNGSLAHLGRLAEQFLSRFLIRCRARRYWSDDFRLDQALSAVARTIGGPQSYSMDDWETGCKPVLGRTEATLLYRECLTYGLIRREQEPHWRWRHRFVVDYLAAQPDLRSQ